MRIRHADRQGVPHTHLEIELSQNPVGLKSTPLQGIEGGELDRILDKGNKKYGRMLKRLAE